MIKFVLDSSSDNLTKELMEIDRQMYPECAIEVVPLSLSTNEDSFVDDINLNVPEMITVMENYKGRTFTACPSTESWIEAYRGYDEIFVITITSGLSGTYNSAMTAKNLYLEENPDAKVEVYDSRSTGPALRLILEKMLELNKQGMSFDDINKEVREYVKTNRTFFILQSLHNLAENGRVNKLVAAAIGVLGINLVGTASPEGTIKVIAKNRGEKKTVATTYEETLKAGYKGGKIRICHVENEAMANIFADSIREKFGDVDILIYEARGLCSFYAERGGMVVSCEC